MSLKKYSELTEAEKGRVKVMYSDLTNQEQYLYDFDNNGEYHGRQYAPPSGKDEKTGLPFGTIHAESKFPDLKVVEPEEEKLPESLVETQPVKKTRGKAKKK